MGSSFEFKRDDQSITDFIKSTLLDTTKNKHLYSKWFKKRNDRVRKKLQSKNNASETIAVKGFKIT